MAQIIKKGLKMLTKSINNYVQHTVPCSL